MNTTEKYIYQLKEIDPLSFKEVGVIGLSLEVVNKEIDSFQLSNYELNNFGQIKSCKRKEFGWTAFPPLNGSIKVNDKAKVKILGFTENFKYENGELKSSELKEDENQKIKSKVAYIFYKSLLTEIKKSYYQGEEILVDSQVYIYNLNNQIVRINRTTQVDKHTKIEIETNFDINKEGLVAEKNIRHVTRIGGANISYTSMEKFKYNSKGQLENSIQSVKFDQKEIVTKIQFEYLTLNCNLISKIRTQEEGTKTTIKEYQYDEEKRLECIKIENSGNETKTIYKRKKRPTHNIA